ncbi:uncharacterized protein UTRI_00617_B [Ustilago trichophora]|uniref:Uncharacterized protein n=1 Tax=Ustilago trichophora TaxID=86804 RepID=A0A5C3DSN7_9BASI|nr:uncharacterized protein UTRI_00617_B [Ustilago trichophora]
MSSKNKMSKFKSAVAASSSSSSSSSTPSTAGITPLTIAQGNTLQALHQEQLARLACTTLPNLASLHSRRFLTLARAQTVAADSMWTTQKLQSTQYRKSLWAEDVEPEQADEMAKVVPDFYHKHNGRCSRCALPLVPGLNQLSLPGKDQKKNRRKTQGSTEKKRAERGKTRKRVSCCGSCGHKIRS